jgi:hypothetical protein
MKWPRQLAILLLSVGVLASLANFGWRTVNEYRKKPIDMLIFADAGKKFWVTGQLYKRVDDYPDRYHPSAAIFKFPPPFQLMLAPWFKSGIPDLFLKIVKYSMLVMFFISLFLWWKHLSVIFSLPAEHQKLFAALIIISSSWMMPFYESFRWVLTEIPLLFIFILTCTLYQKNRFIPASLLAFAGAIKIYPGFVFAWQMFKRDWKSLLYFCLSFIAIFATSIAVFGADEHRFYFDNILPVLLQEPVINKSVNLNLENFFVALGFMNENNGLIFNGSRLAVLMSLAWLFFTKREQVCEQPTVLFSLIVTAMFFCFPNYWPQYQIYLIIPVYTCLAMALANNNLKLLGVAFICFFLMCFSEQLGRSLLSANMLQIGMDQEALSNMIRERGIHAAMLEISPTAWFVSVMYNSRALVPLMLFIPLLLQLSMPEPASREKNST